MTIRLALVECAPDAAASLRAYLAPQPDFEVIAEVPSTETSLGYLQTVQPDALFLDMTTSPLTRLNIDSVFFGAGRPIVVMLADEEAHAVRAFELGASDYLVKPIQPARFSSTLQRIREQMLLRRSADAHISSVPPAIDVQPTQTRNPARILVTERRRTRCIDVSEIEWIKAAGDYSEIHVQNSCHLLREPISMLMDRLPPGAFCRIHRSAIVNLNRVTGFVSLRNNDLLVRLKGKTVLRASRTFSQRLRTGLHELERSSSMA